ncbi:hypothetical protein OROHE_017208 [Orobanche hederae]
MDGKRRAHILEITLDQTYPRSPPSVSAIRQNCDGIFQKKSMYPNYSRKCEQVLLEVESGGWRCFAFSFSKF